MDVVHYILNKEEVVRAKPSHFRISKSPALKTNKNKFAICVDFSSRIKSNIIKTIWDEKAKKLKARYRIHPNRTRRPSGYNLFMKYNLQLFRENAPFVDQDRIVISIGKLSIPHDFKAERDKDNPENIIVSFSNIPLKTQTNKNDHLCILAAIENELFLFYFPLITRGSGGGTFNFKGSAGQKIRLWAYFKDEFDYLFSESVTTLIDTK